VTLPRGLFREECVDHVLVRVRTFPELSNALPFLAEALGVGIRIRDDECLDTVGMGCHQSEAHGPAVVMEVKRIARQAQLLQQTVHGLREMIEGVCVVRGVWRIALPE